MDSLEHSEMVGGFSADSHFQPMNDQLVDNLYSVYNPYISVKVHEPMWSSDGHTGKHRLYKINTIMSDNPDYSY